MAKVSEHFTEDEVKCNCGCGFKIIQPLFLYRLELARSFKEFSFIINSWCRCEKYNREVKGVSNSSHLTGWAVDIRTYNDTHAKMIMHSLLCAGFTRIGLGTTYIHVDCDPSKPQYSIWLE